eukprot:353500-Chlamydomonas_euryale.AAC.11
MHALYACPPSACGRRLRMHVLHVKGPCIDGTSRSPTGSPATVHFHLTQPHLRELRLSPPGRGNAFGGLHAGRDVCMRAGVSASGSDDCTGMGCLYVVAAAAAAALHGTCFG